MSKKRNYFGQKSFSVLFFFFSKNPKELPGASRSRGVPFDVEVVQTAIKKIFAGDEQYRSTPHNLIYEITVVCVVIPIII